MSVKVITTGEIQYICDTLDAVVSLDEALQYEEASLPNELMLMVEDCFEILESILLSVDHPIPDKDSNEST